MCAVKVNLAIANIIIISIYKSPTRNFSYFLHELDTILNPFIKCGDININYLNKVIKDIN
jgi:hypothetical protein